MRRIESIEDDMRSLATYELPNGRRVTLDARAVREHGSGPLLRAMGHPVSTKRVPVMQYGRQVGTMPGDFDPLCAKSKSIFYDYRHGDLRREGSVWIAAQSLGARDLDCLVGFERNRD